jgi:hypothetical protein
MYETTAKNKDFKASGNDILTLVKTGKQHGSTDDDSAYSSCCINQSSSNNSTPKTVSKNALNHKMNASTGAVAGGGGHMIVNRKASCNQPDSLLLDNEEDITSILHSSSSCSSSPLSSNIAKLNVSKLVLPIYSEYESVKDTIVKLKAATTTANPTTTPQPPPVPVTNPTPTTATLRNRSNSKKAEKSLDEIKSDNDLFKSTITAFDILTERCSELIELFDENNKDPGEIRTSRVSSTNEDKLSPHEALPPPVTPVVQPPILIEHSSPLAVNEDSLAKSTLTGYSKFLERTLTFDYLMKSSVLLSSSSSLTPLSPSSAVEIKPPPPHPIVQHISACSSSDSTASSSSSSSSSSCSASSFDDLNTTSSNFNSIRNLIFRMAKNERSLFGKNVSEFLNCTHKSKEQNPNTLMSNIRQFMNGIKNYLIKNISDAHNLDLRLLIEKERANLDLTQILNIDSLIEDCLQSIVLRPLKAKIYYLLVDWLVNDNSLILISKNIKRINEDEHTDTTEKYLGLFRKREHRPTSGTLKQLRNYYNRMQCEYAPLIKLKYVLFIINELLSSIKDFEHALSDFGQLNLVEFLPIVIYAMAKCGMYAIQIEIDYIWNLANKQLLTNETIYYLTLMSSACYILKSIDFNQPVVVKETIASNVTAATSAANFSNSFDINSLNSESTTTGGCGGGNTCLAYMNMGLIDVYLPDDKYQTLKVKKIPVKPNSKCKEVCYLIASRFKIYNYEDYALYFIENGVEYRVREDERPLEIKNEKIKLNPNIKFIFKQKSLNILWPKSIETF